jgi:hypothetical protein
MSLSDSVRLCPCRVTIKENKMSVNSSISSLQVNYAVLNYGKKFLDCNIR